MRRLLLDPLSSIFLSSVPRRLTVAFACALLLGSIGCGDSTSGEGGVLTNSTSEEATAQSEINGTGSFDFELTQSFDGRFPEVMQYRGCTGTIIGPHAVITAAHCGGSTGSNEVWWPAEDIGTSLPDLFFNAPSGSNVVNPYSVSGRYPNWWKALPNRGSGDWPAMHDLRVVFVENMDADWIADNIRLEGGSYPTLNAGTTPSWRYSVGVCSTNDNGGQAQNACEDREFIEVDYRTDTNAGDIQNSPRDGYATLDATSGEDLDTLQPGDSGGPTIGIHRYWYDGQYIDQNRHLLSTHQNNQFQDDAPLSYGLGISLTTNQETTIRLNQLWTKAAVADADNDGLTRLCDSDPSDPSGSSNNCTTFMGNTDVNVPKGLLQCGDRYTATGIRGNAGWGIDSLAVRCTPRVCLRYNENCDDEHWSDHFGLSNPGGAAFTETCSSGNAITYVRGRASSTAVNELQVYCSDYEEKVENNVLYNGEALSIVGNDWNNLNNGSPVSWQDCDYGTFQGFEPRNNQSNGDLLKTLTGLQPICDSDDWETEFRGNINDWHSRQMCPGGYIGVGFVGMDHMLNSNYVGAFGMLCAPTVRQSGDYAGDYLVVHGDFENNSYEKYPRMIESYSQFSSRDGHSNSLQPKLCPSGSRVEEINFRYDWAGVTTVDSFKCHDPATSQNYLIFMPTIGSATGTSTSLDCGNDAVVGLALTSDSRTEGLGLICGADD